MGVVQSVEKLSQIDLQDPAATDPHRLIELCGLTDTLLVDEDGIYNPADFNDRLVLGMKGTMSAAELHFLRARLQGGKRHKAEKGELRFPVPVGLCWDERNRIVLDPDEQVRSAVALVFRIFRQRASAYAVARCFADQGLEFPKRAYGGAWDGKLIWGRLSDRRVLSILKNPAYAGVYAFGRYRCVKEILEDGEIRSKVRLMPRAEWLVEIRDHHEGYVSFEQYLDNLDRLERNRTNGDPLPGPAREGLAHLQGLLVCVRCGRRLTVRYKTGVPDWPDGANSGVTGPDSLPESHAHGAPYRSVSGGVFLGTAQTRGRILSPPGSTVTVLMVGFGRHSGIRKR